MSIAADGSPSESARLEALRAYRILDTPPEQRFDDLVELAAAACNTPTAAIAFVDEDRSWLKAKRGTGVSVLPRELALTGEALSHDDVFVVTDATADERYRSTPLVASGFRFFAGVPLRSPDGHALGTVCVLDTRPRFLSDTQEDALRAIARHVMSELELRRVSEAESVARHRYRSLVEQLPGGVYIEPLDASSASYISPQIEQLTGYTAEEWASDPDFFAGVLHPDDRERVLRAFSDVHETYGSIQIEYRVIAKDGRVVWVQDDGAVAHDDEGEPLYLQGFMADVTARKLDELKLRDIQERYRELAEQLPFVTYVDDRGGAGYVSPQVEELTGFTPAQWLDAASGFLSFAHPDDRAHAAGEVQKAKERVQPWVLEYRLVTAGGREIWVQDTAVPIRRVSGELRYWQGYIVDITERRALAAERDELLEREREQNVRLRSLDRLKDEFVAVVSHELRTPLTSIRGYLELVLEDADSLPAAHREFLEVVDRNAGRLISLVSDLLLMAQADAGRLSFDWSEVDLEPIVAQCVKAARPAAEESGVTLAFESELSRAIPGDSARIAQLLDNLISNAIKFTPAGGRVDVLVSASGDSAVLEVKDTGYGIGKEEQEQLFERFFRTRSANEKAIQGTGLGLSIVKAIVDAHGGTIGVESVEGAGTTFHVELPLVRAAADLRHVA